MPEQPSQNTPRRRERFHGRVEREGVCQHPGCEDPGEFRAPAPDGSAAKWQYLCLDHVREFNAAYSWKGPTPGPTDRWDRIAREFARNGYANAFRDDLDIFGGQATREFKRPAARRWTASQREALTVMDLGEKASADTIRVRYKELVRQFHPDMNGGDRSHEARLQAVIDAYSDLRKSKAFREENRK